MFIEYYELKVSETEIQEANEEYQSLSDLVLSSLPDILLQPLLARLQLQVNGNGDDSSTSAKKWLYSTDPTLKSVVSKEALQWRRGAVSQVCTIESIEIYVKCIFFLLPNRRI